MEGVGKEHIGFDVLLGQWIRGPFGKRGRVRRGENVHLLFLREGRCRDKIDGVLYRTSYRVLPDIEVFSTRRGPL